MCYVRLRPSAYVHETSFLPIPVAAVHVCTYADLYLLGWADWLDLTGTNSMSEVMLKLPTTWLTLATLCCAERRGSKNVFLIDNIYFWRFLEANVWLDPTHIESKWGCWRFYNEPSSENENISRTTDDVEVKFIETEKLSSPPLRVASSASLAALVFINISTRHIRLIVYVLFIHADDVSLLSQREQQLVKLAIKCRSIFGGEKQHFESLALFDVCARDDSIHPTRNRAIICIQ